MARRYETHHQRLMTLYVTRQSQQFVVANDLELVDIELIRSSVELVGEPGFDFNSGIGMGHAGAAYDSAGATVPDANPTYLSTVNQLYALNRTGTSTVHGVTGLNGVQHTTHINHGWVNIQIDGMMENRQFMQDERYQENQLSLVVPTDSGVLSIRSMQQNGPPHPLLLQNIKMQPQVTIHTDFAGIWPKQKRRARFVEDYADTNPAVLRNADGTVRYYQDDSGGAAIGPSQIPANMINCIVLQFCIKPRSTL